MKQHKDVKRVHFKTLKRDGARIIQPMLACDAANATATDATPSLSAMPPVASELAHPASLSLSDLPGKCEAAGAGAGLALTVPPVPPVYAQRFKRHCGTDLRNAIDRHKTIVLHDMKTSGKEQPQLRPCHVLECHSHKWYRLAFHPELPDFPLHVATVTNALAVGTSRIQLRATEQIEQLLWDREHAAGPCNSFTANAQKLNLPFGSWRDVMATFVATEQPVLSVRKRRRQDSELQDEKCDEPLQHQHSADVPLHEDSDSKFQTRLPQPDATEEVDETAFPLLTQALEWWQNGERMCDLELVWGQHSVRVHHFVLCATTDYFAAARHFEAASTSSLAASSGVLARRCILPQWTGGVHLLRMFCELLYCAPVDLKSVSQEDQVALLANADFYGATWLAFRLLRHLNTHVTVMTPVCLLNLARFHHVPLVTRLAEALACHYAPSVLAAGMLDGLNPTDTETLVAHTGFRAHELDIFLWLRRQVEQQELTETAAAQLCHKHMRWGQIGLVDLQRHVQPCRWVDRSAIDTLLRQCAPRTALASKIVMAPHAMQPVTVSLDDLPGLEVQLCNQRFEHDDDDDDDDNDEDDAEAKQERIWRKSGVLLFDCDSASTGGTVITDGSALGQDVAVTVVLPPENACWFVGANVTLANPQTTWMKIEWCLDEAPRPNCACVPRVSTALPCDHRTWCTVAHFEPGSTRNWTYQSLRWGSDAARPCGRSRRWRVVFGTYATPWQLRGHRFLRRVTWLIQH